MQKLRFALLTNALKFSPLRGAIRLRLRGVGDEDGREVDGLSFDPTTRTVHIKVSHDGTEYPTRAVPLERFEFVEFLAEAPAPVGTDRPRKVA
jgi:signal transduction histidine kinase